MKKYLKKSLAVGIICILMLISLPIINGKRIEYPKEDGPYTVYICGFCRGFGSNAYIDFNSKVWSFWNLTYIQRIGYSFRFLSVFFVNGSLQKIKYPASIDLKGFQGFAPTVWMIYLKLYMGRCRIVGKCDEIIVWDSLEKSF